MKAKPVAKTRSSNFEFLRIIAMLGVVIAHMIGYSAEASIMFTEDSKQTLYLAILSCAGKIGLSVFVMISGYFLVKSEFKWQRIFKVWKPTWVWSVGLLIIGLLTGAVAATKDKIIPGIFPVLTGEYWFVPTYILVVLISPVINNLLTKTPQKKLFKLLLITVVAFYGVNLLTGLCGMRLDLAISQRVLTYLLVYMVGGYIRLYPPKLSQSKRWLLLILSILILSAWRWVMIYIRNLRGVDLWVAEDQDIFIFLVALAIFLVGAGSKMKQHKIINLIGGGTFAVYLITENPVVRPILWSRINIYSVWGTKWLYLYPFVLGIIITVACALLEAARSKADAKLNAGVSRLIQQKKA